ncbi:protein of unknown function [Devosia crocina]|uniref:DUF4394 domain-containing protein n=1 Tax=Devosia crocina TaxID=429728 RepID=A0A1I7N703_9HYPH|nr:DUF4394 domain-containing protein [Devosia crocina]SFV30421.1 protein of unknown function [Devosia crocina]
MPATARFFMTTSLTLVASAIGVGATHAATAVALIDGTSLAMVDTETRAVTGTLEVSGVDGLAGIDIRPADGMLYGVSLSGQIVTIDTSTGAATMGAELSEKLPSYDGAIVDFNPVADRLRLMGTDGTNHRVNVDDGAVTVDGSLAFDAEDMHAGETPAVVDAAYTNSIGSPEETAMYDIDATLAALLQQVSPNDGTLAAVGELGIEGGSNYAFDIHTTEDMTNTAYLVVDNTLYTVDLETGAAESWGMIEGVDGTITDITVMN